VPVSVYNSQLGHEIAVYCPFPSCRTVTTSCRWGHVSHERWLFDDRPTLSFRSQSIAQRGAISEPPQCSEKQDSATVQLQHPSLPSSSDCCLFIFEPRQASLCMHLEFAQQSARHYSKRRVVRILIYLAARHRHTTSLLELAKKQLQTSGEMFIPQGVPPSSVLSAHRTRSTERLRGLGGPPSKSAILLNAEENEHVSY